MTLRISIRMGTSFWVKSIASAGQTFSQAPHNVQLSISIAAILGEAVLNGI